MAKTDLSAKGSNGISSFLVDSNLNGIEIGKTPKMLGQIGSSSPEVHFNNCKVNKDIGPDCINSEDKYCRMPNRSLSNNFNTTKVNDDFFQRQLTVGCEPSLTTPSIFRNNTRMNGVINSRYSASHPRFMKVDHRQPDQNN